jgi:transglutaminase-like putative cysteine protease
MNRESYKKTIIIFLILSILTPPIQSTSYKEKTNEINLNILNDFVRIRWKPKETTIKFVETIQNNEQFPVNVHVYIPIPKTRYNQDIKDTVLFEPNPNQILIDKWGQEVAFFNLTIQPHKNISIIETIQATIYSTRYLLVPFFVCGNIPENILSRYTEDDSKYQINDPLIQNIVDQIISNSTNIIINALKIHQYVIKNIEYDFDGRGNWDDAPTVLKRGNGSCSEYCYVYISLLRAAGIPARYIGGSYYTKDVEPDSDKLFHRIVEIYIPNYGWIPVDATKNDYASIPFYHFGAIENRFLITLSGGGSSEYLEWKYTHQEEIYPESANIDITASFIWENQ